MLAGKQLLCLQDFQPWKKHDNVLLQHRATFLTAYTRTAVSKQQIRR